MYQSIKPTILEQLRSGPLTLPDVAAAIDEAEFLVRAELRSLQRDRLVTTKFEHAGEAGHFWELTDRGVKTANQADQMRLA